jgi:hypothetical protein
MSSPVLEILMNMKEPGPMLPDVTSECVADIPQLRRQYAYAYLVQRLTINGVLPVPNCVVGVTSAVRTDRTGSAVKSVSDGYFHI